MESTLFSETKKEVTSQKDPDFYTLHAFFCSLYLPIPKDFDELESNASKQLAQLGARKSDLLSLSRRQYDLYRVIQNTVSISPGDQVLLKCRKGPSQEGSVVGKTRLNSEISEYLQDTKLKISENGFLLVPPITDMPKMVVFGDSIPELSDYYPVHGTCPTLQRDFTNLFHLMGRCHSGMNTRQALQILPYDLPDTNMAVFIIVLAANDVILDPNNLRHVPKSECVQNIKDIILHPKAQAQNPVTIVVTPPAVRGEDQYTYVSGKRACIRSNAITAEYVQAIKREVGLLHDKNVFVCDLFNAIMEADNRNGLYEENDDQHLAERGYAIFYHELKATLRAAGIIAPNWA